MHRIRRKWSSVITWSHPYSRREQAAYPRGPRCVSHKFWPAVGRIDNVHGDRNLVCSCVGMEAYSASRRVVMTDSCNDNHEHTTPLPPAPATKSQGYVYFARLVQ